MSELEKKLLSRLTSAEAMAEIYDEGVRAEVFEEPLYQAVWAFSLKYWQNAKRKAVPTLWALQQEFPGYEIGDEAPEERAYLAHLLRQRYVTLQLQLMMRGATDTMFTDPVGTLKTLHATAYQASEVVTPRLTRTNMADTIEERREEYGRLEEFPQGMGVPYGLDLLDLHTGGLLPGELAVIGGYAKTGKTMMGLHCASSMVRAGYRPLVFSLEMSLKECTKRLDAMFSGVSYNRLLKGHLTIPELKKLHEAQEELRDLGGIQIEMPDVEDRTVPHLINRARQYGADWVFIDQLSRMELGRKTNDLKDHHGSLVKALKVDISRAGNEIPVMLAAQFKRNEEEISIESFANAAEIEREADILLGLSRNKDLRNNHMMRCDILGARRGDMASYLLRWELTEATEIKVDSEIR